MQETPYEIKEKLLQALDNEYNVVDMAAVLEVITALEKAIITKEALERTRIGKYINELRKRTNNEQLARRAKDLVKSWRKLLPQTQERLNGEETHTSIPSPGSMTLLESGPDSCIGSDNQTFKQFASVPGTSPSFIIDHSSSPYFSSASNSPLLNSFQGASMPSNYAPVKVGCRLNSLSKNLFIVSNQSKNSQIFVPLSPSTIKDHSSVTPSGLYASLSLPRTFSNISPGLNSNSSSISPSINTSQNIPLQLNSSVLHSSLDLAKTNVANKRLRKETSCGYSSPEIEVITLDSPVRNGESEPIKNISAVGSSVLVSSKNSNCVENEKNSFTIKLKKHKRKKSYDKNELLENKLLDTLASSSKYPKVKTTQQLIADLQAKKNVSTVLSPNSLSPIDSLHSSEAEVSRTKSELLNKFLCSTQSAQDESDEESSLLILNPVSDTPSVINTSFAYSSNDPVDEEIQNILSALPPINKAEINLEDAYFSPKRPTSVTDDLQKLEKSWEYVNGMYDCHGNWKSWQESAEQRSNLGESFQVMPYVNID